jgi:hypothetical protein
MINGPGSAAPPSCLNCEYQRIELHIWAYYCHHPKSMGDKMPDGGTIMRKIDSLLVQPLWCPLRKEQVR